MTRAIAAFVFTVLLAAAPGATAAPAAAGESAPMAPGAYTPIALVAPSVTVDDSLVRLSDIFTGANDKAAATAVAYAPAPGKTLTLDAPWLARTARRHGLEWQPSDPREHVLVQRRSFVVSREDVEQRARALLAERENGADMVVEILNSNFRLYAAGDAAGDFALDDVSFDRLTRRFEATVIAPANSTSAQRVRVSGRAHKMIAVPVPKRPVSKGEILRDDDLEFTRLKVDQVQPEITLDSALLVGKAAVRGLRAGQPVAARDVERPILVTKDSPVTIVLQAPQMRLTTRGRALDAGGQGDVIRIVNNQSKQTVEGTVVAAGQVLVKPFGALAEMRPAIN
ncbi:MAG: flagellar basal body P-ring formation chaperone FlgA [Pseudomonadota bacterium]